MPTNQQIEEFRKAVLLFSVASEKPLLGMGRTMSRSLSEETDCDRCLSEAITAARVTGQNDAIPFLRAIYKPIKSAIDAHNQMWQGCKENSGKISRAKQEEFLKALRECTAEYISACEELDEIAGLRSPIETREKEPPDDESALLTADSPLAEEFRDGNQWCDVRYAETLGVSSKQIDRARKDGVYEVRLTTRRKADTSGKPFVYRRAELKELAEAIPDEFKIGVEALGNPASKSPQKKTHYR